jgi:hypothetical protein
MFRKNSKIISKRKINFYEFYLWNIILIRIETLVTELKLTNKFWRNKLNNLIARKLNS